ncbi:MAG TPA: alpha/beta hydrolase [Mycobacteriales bacterium]|nr:alpha/beta hydrolase [Mycobacteriales bacterium]
MDVSRFPTLDPELLPILDLLPEMPDALDDLSVARAFLHSFLPTGPLPHENEVDVADLQLPGGVRLRVYRPAASEGPLPGILHIHGGGFCLGSIETEHAGALGLSYALGALVVSVDYRLAPEHPYPAGLEDCLAGLDHLAGMNQVDPDRLIVHGQSAGGGLAAAVALRARDAGGPALAFQSLGIPELDDRLETPSMQAFVDTPLWSRPQAIRSWEYYLGGKPADGYAAPARMADVSGLPPAYITTMELDPLRDEGILYAMRLLAAGVSVELHSFPGTFHGSAVAVDAAVSRRMSEELLVVLARRLGTRVRR